MAGLLTGRCWDAAGLNGGLHISRLNGLVTAANVVMTGWVRKAGPVTVEVLLIRER